MRLHVIGMPHTQTTPDYDNCSTTSKIRKFATMMSAREHDVTLYAGDENTARCSELVTCITRNEQHQLFDGQWWYEQRAPYAFPCDDGPAWQLFHTRVIEALHERLEPQDIICLTGGWAQRALIDAFPAHLKVEAGVGYEGVNPAGTHRVFESYAWMHCIYGVTGAGGTDGRFYDDVIPNFYEVADFPFSADKDDYVLFLSRMTQRKGYQIAFEATRVADRPLVIAGSGGDRPHEDHATYTGYVDNERRGELLARARAVMVPTIYIEPFGGVAVEAMLCGTPVITTDWGAFTETVGQGVDGYRCRMLGEFVEAIERAGDLDPAVIRERAIARFSTDRVGEQYERYFERLLTLFGAGFYHACAVA